MSILMSLGYSNSLSNLYGCFPSAVFHPGGSISLTVPITIVSEWSLSSLWVYGMKSIHMLIPMGSLLLFCSSVLLLEVLDSA